MDKTNTGLPDIDPQSLYQKLPGVLLPWYRENARTLPWRDDQEPYHIWISEIMLQQTRVETVKGYYNRFLASLPTIKDLAEAPEDQLFKLWEGLGYYSRVRNLQKAARLIINQHGGMFPRNLKDIRALPGIGPYTAGAIASICFSLPTPAVDGNVLRVVSRITEDYTCIDLPETKKRISDELSAVYPKESSGDFTQSLMELGATICLPGTQPQCPLCPARSFCLALKNGTASILPVKAVKRMRRVEKRTVFLIGCGERIALRHRKDAGLLSGLWELPNVEGFLTEQEAFSVAESWGISPTLLKSRVQKSHIFTHIEWQMICYAIDCRNPAALFTWANREQLESLFALPTAFGKFITD